MDWFLHKPSKSDFNSLIQIFQDGEIRRQEQNQNGEVVHFFPKRGDYEMISAYYVAQLARNPFCSAIIIRIYDRHFKSHRVELKSYSDLTAIKQKLRSAIE